MKNFPTSNSEYIGIGRADKFNYPYKYKQIASEKALTQISREISIHIQTQTSLIQNENSLGINESWFQEVWTRSGNNLWGYELVDTWETPLEFWAFYKLNREKYTMYIKNKFKTKVTGLRLELEKIKDNLHDKRLQNAINSFHRAHKIFMEFEQAEKEGETLDKNLTFKYYFWRDTLSKIISRTELTTNKNTLTIEPHRVAQDRVSLKFTLKDTRSGNHWKGPFALLLNHSDEFNHSHCEINTTDQGVVKFNDLLAFCKPKAGRWNFCWKIPPLPWNKLISPLSQNLHTRTTIDVKIKPLKITWKIQNWDTNIPKNLKALVLETLKFSASDQLFHHDSLGTEKIVFLYIKEFHQDSLHGIHFTSFKGSINTEAQGSDFGPILINGKGGHSQKNRSIQLAVNDFVNQINQIIGPYFHYL